MKLIHSGKVLKDDSNIEACGIKPNDFLVVMVTKARKAASAPAPAPAPPADAEAKTPAGAAASAPDRAATSTDAIPAAFSSADAPADPSRPSAADEFPAEVVANLTGMGFPDPEVRHCLRAANGNPDVAMEFLTNGIPPGVEAAASGAGAASPAAGGASGGSLQALRSHPQFNQLRRLVQTNPAMLQTVLTQIGQQQPELLAEINANQAAFLAMMNEPISDAPASAASAGSSGSSLRGAAGLGGAAGMLEGMANPAQMAQMIQSMSPAELNQMAQMMGLSPDQLRQTAQMLGQIPPEQLQQYMMQAMGGGGGLGDLMGGAAGGAGGGPQVLRLNEEEMAAVDRLTEMGFDRAEAAQAFLACDKNEALAANLLMDSMGDGGGFFGGDAPGAGGNSNDNNDGGGDGDNDDDAMYD